jgi:DNA-binding Xre family transcriptional regulator
MKHELEIGQLIRAEMEKEGRKAVWLANKINYEKSKITRIYQGEDIKINVLAEICIHLEVDFLEYCSEYVREEIGRKKGIS